MHSWESFNHDSWESNDRLFQHEHEFKKIINYQLSNLQMTKKLGNSKWKQCDENKNATIYNWFSQPFNSGQVRRKRRDEEIHES